MKKSLSESSFRSINSMSPDELKGYLERNGEVYWSNNIKIDNQIVSGWIWARKEPVEYDYNILTHEDLIKLQLGTWLKSMEEEGAAGTASNSISIEAYNTFASCDEWHGGYVEGFGYIGVAASSLYGNSLYLSGSWHACGTLQNPVRVAKYYKLTFEDRWRGGYVKSWGHVSESTKVLGCSTETITKVGEGERTLGTLINVETSLGRKMTSIESMKSKFKDFWNVEKRSYEIDDKTLSEYIRKNFYYATTDKVEQGLADHKTVLLRKVTKVIEDDYVIKKYGYDVMAVDYDAMKHNYECIDPIGPSVISISKKDARDGKIEVQTHVLSRS